MPPKKAEPAVKRGRGRPPKIATTPVGRSAPVGNTRPLKGGRGRPPTTANTPKPAAAVPTPLAKKQRGRPAKSDPTSKKPRGRPSYQTAPTTARAPAKIPSAGVTKKRGRPPGSTNAKKKTTVLTASKASKANSKTLTKTKAKAPTTVSTARSKGGRPKGKHVSNLSTNLKSLISSASKGRLVELLSVLCERNATVAKATSNALREEEIRRQEQGQERENGTKGGSGEDVLVEESEDALGAVDDGEQGKDGNGDHDGLAVSKTHHPGKTNGVAKGKGKGKGKAKVNKDASGHISTEKNIHVTVGDDQQVHTEQGTEPKSGYEADVELEIPATATEAGDGGAGGGILSQEDEDEDATAESETIAQAVSFVRDSAFTL